MPSNQRPIDSSSVGRFVHSKPANESRQNLPGRSAKPGRSILAGRINLADQLDSQESPPAPDPIRHAEIAHLHRPANHAEARREAAPPGAIAPHPPPAQRASDSGRQAVRAAQRASGPRNARSGRPSTNGRGEAVKVGLSARKQCNKHTCCITQAMRKQCISYTCCIRSVPVACFSVPQVCNSAA